MYIGGLPFTSVNVSSAAGSVIINYMTGAAQAATGQTISGSQAKDTTYAALYEWDSTEGTTAFQSGNLSVNNYVWFNIFYRA